MNELSPTEIFEERMPRRVAEKPELKAKLDRVIRFDIAGPRGGTWVLDPAKGEDWISTDAGGAEPMVTVRISDDDFVALVEKRLSPQGAMMTGKLKLEPMSLAVAKVLGKLLG